MSHNAAHTQQTSNTECGTLQHTPIFTLIHTPLIGPALVVKGVAIY